MLFKQRWVYFKFIVLAVFSFSLAAHTAVSYYVPAGESLDLGFPLFSLRHVQNSGVAFSFLQNASPWLLVLVNLILVLGILVWARGNALIQQSRLARSALAFILGGALGNIVDRWQDGQVLDYIELSFIDYPVFNLPDTAISIGTGALIALLLRDMFRKEKDGA